MNSLSQNTPTITDINIRTVKMEDMKATQAVMRFHATLLKQFEDFWSQSRGQIEQQLAIRGNRGVYAFNQHQAGVVYCLSCGLTWEPRVTALPYTKHESGDLAGHVTLND